MNLVCPAQFSSVQLLSHPGLQHARPPAAPGFFSKKAGMEMPPGSWSLKLEVPRLQTGGHKANHFGKTCIPRLQRGVKKTKDRGDLWEEFCK